MKKKIENLIDSVITPLERHLSKHSVLSLFVIAYSFTIIRNFLESSFEEAAKIGFSPFPFSSIIAYFYHYPLYYFNVYIFVAIILTLGGAYKYKDALKFSLFFAFWVIIAPFVDLFLGGHFDINYIMHSNQFLFYFINSLNPFVKAPGITTGIRVESFLALVGILVVLIYKSKKVLRSVFLIFALYVFLLLTAGTLQALFAESFGTTLYDAFHAPGIIFYPSLKFALFLFIILVIELLFGMFLYSPRRFIRYIALVRWERILFYLSVVTMGFLIGLKSLAFGFPLIFHNPTDFLAIIALFGHTFFGFLFGLVINDYFDRNGDLLAGQKTPFTLRIIRKQELPYLAIFFFLTSLIFAFSISYYTALVALTALILSYIYSAPPYRLKKYWPVSVYTISTIAFLEMVVGVSTLAKYAAINILPVEVFYVFFLIFPLAFGTKDLKDYEGDKATGVFTIFTWLGLKKGCILNAILVFTAFMVVPAVYGKNFLLLSLLLGLPTSLYIMFYPKFKHSRPREIIFFSVLIFYILYMAKATIERVKQPVDLKKLMNELQIDESALIPRSGYQEKAIFDALINPQDSLFYLLKARFYAGKVPILSFYYLDKLTDIMEKKKDPSFYNFKYYMEYRFKALKQLMDADSINLAIAYAFKYLPYGPYSEKFYLALGKMLMEKERYDGALEALKGAFFLHPNEESALDLALTYKELGEQDSFIKYFNEYLKYKPK